MTTLSIARPSHETERILTRSFAVGVVYASARMLAAALLGAASRLPGTWDNALVWVLTGTLTCLSLSPFIRHSSRPRQQTLLAVWAALAFVRSIGLGIEGAMYVPATAPYAPISVLAGVVIDLHAGGNRQPGGGRCAEGPRLVWQGRLCHRVQAWRAGLAFTQFCLARRETGREKTRASSPAF